MNDGNQGFPNDIALIELSEPAHVESNFVEIVPMAAEGADFVGSTCYITGWGVTDSKLSTLTTLEPDICG